MVTVVTLNPCIDRTIEVEEWKRGCTNKVMKIRQDVSGKGINVNVILQNLGISNTAVGFDFTDGNDTVKGFMDKQGCQSALINVPGELRVNTKIFERTSGVMSEFNERGRTVKKDDITQLKSMLEERLCDAGLLVLGGSVPPGVPDDIYKQMITSAGERGVKTVLDASGRLLLRGIEAKPFLIKPNQEELAEALGIRLDDISQIVTAAREIIKYGVEKVCVSRGSKGAVFISRSNVYIAEPIDVKIRGVQGAGDSMVAGFCYALEKGMDDGQVFRYGVICAAASLTHEATSLCTKEDLECFRHKVQIKKLLM